MDENIRALMERALERLDEVKDQIKAVLQAGAEGAEGPDGPAEPGSPDAPEASSPAPKRLPYIPPRELQLLKLACNPKGYTYRRMAKMMNVSYGTICIYRQRLWDRIECENKVGMIIWGRDNGYG
jgi:DNA-binding NarL/FixJ family response regulator